MSIKRSELEKFLNNLLDISEYKDYGPNGLQVEGSDEISSIAFAVSATKDSIEKAVAGGANALIVHHGLFWKFTGARAITGTFAKRVKPLIQNDINLLGYHLPLDAHIEHGNAAGLAKGLGLQHVSAFGNYSGMPVGVQGKLSKKMSPTDFQAQLKMLLNHEIIMACPEDCHEISSVGIITGGANNEWPQALEAGLDAYITGEISEYNWHDAKEAGICYFAGGHSATERFGVQGLEKAILEQFSDKNLSTFFIDSDNPA